MPFGNRAWIVVLAVALAALALGWFLQSVAFLFLFVAAAIVARSMERGLVSQSSLALGLFLFGLAAAEWTAPLLFPAPPKLTETKFENGYFQRVDDIGTEPRIGVSGSSKRSTEGELIYDVLYTVGENHLRVTPGSPPGPARANFFGSSFLYGEGLQDNETLPHYYALAAGGVAVRNFGFHGRGPHHALAILESSGRDTRGELNIFLTQAWHATLSGCRPTWNDHSPRYSLSEDGTARRNGMCDDAGNLPRYLLANGASWSNVLAIADRSVRGWRTVGDLDLYVAIVRRMAEISRERGQRFVVAFTNTGGDALVSTGYSDGRLVEAFKAFADDVVIMDLPVPPQTDPWRYKIHPLDGHPTARANRESAALLVDRLKKHLR
jgi:hypothetical protein